MVEVGADDVVVAVLFTVAVALSVAVAEEEVVKDAVKVEVVALTPRPGVDP